MPPVLRPSKFQPASRPPSIGPRRRAIQPVQLGCRRAGQRVFVLDAPVRRKAWLPSSNYCRTERPGVFTKRSVQETFLYLFGSATCALSQLESVMGESVDSLLHKATREFRKAQNAATQGRPLAAVYSHRERAVVFHAKAMLMAHYRKLAT